jgi:hypothetical protein
MKLDSFLIAEYMEACDWRAAAGVLADHFNLRIQLPAEITKYPANIPEKVIYICHDNLSYRWTASGGFSRMRNYPGLGTSLIVYMPETKQSIQT